VEPPPPLPTPPPAKRADTPRGCPVCGDAMDENVAWAHLVSCAANAHAQMSGRFGATIIDLGDGVTVTEVLPGGPADRAGVKKGERILRLDGDYVEDRCVWTDFF
jgi:predicted metalloprotease with PDZ domain